CGGCGETKDGTCPGVQDDLSELLKTIYAADAIVAGSPVYFGSAPPEIMAVLHRMGYIARRMPENPLAGKVLAGVAVGRRGGHNLTLNQLINVAGPLDMTIAGSTYWPMAFGGPIGAVKEDEEGLKTMAVLGRNMARLIQES
ncbi:MAG: flavodoxin family protein, partial [Planctomycetota bacterium]